MLLPYLCPWITACTPKAFCSGFAEDWWHGSAIIGINEKGGHLKTTKIRWCFSSQKNTTYGYSRPQSDRKVNNELFYFGGMTVLHVASPNGNFSCKWIIIRLQRISTFFHRKIGLSPAMSTCQRLFYYCNKTLVVQFMHGKSTLFIIYIYLLVGGLEHLDYFSIQLGIS